MLLSNYILINKLSINNNNIIIIFIYINIIIYTQLLKIKNKKINS